MLSNQIQSIPHRLKWKEAWGERGSNNCLKNTILLLCLSKPDSRILWVNILLQNKVLVEIDLHDAGEWRSTVLQICVFVVVNRGSPHMGVFRSKKLVSEQFRTPKKFLQIKHDHAGSINNSTWRMHVRLISVQPLSLPSRVCRCWEDPPHHHQPHCLTPRYHS